jgi:DNA-binding SARP family transcriptional activator
MNESAISRLRLFGSPCLVREGGARPGSPATQRHRIALLALLALSPGQRLSRDKLMAYLWPESGLRRARKLLNAAVYVLRKELGRDAVLSAGDALLLNTEVVAVDVVELEAALAHADHASVVALYQGPFLDGFFLSDAPEFEHWVDRERERLASAYAKALGSLAETAEREHDFHAAVGWWKARAAEDPFDSRVALRLMQALEASGNRAGALQHAARHERLLQQELEVERTPELAALVDRLRRPGQHEPRSFAVDVQPVAAPAEQATSAAPPNTGVEVRRPEDRPRRVIRYGVAVVVAGGLGIGAIRLVAGGADAPTPDRAQYEREMPDVVAVQDEIARAVAHELGLRLGVPLGVPVRRQPTRNIAAYELYVRGSDPAAYRTTATARTAMDHIEQAIALDSTYAAPYAALTFLHLRLAHALDADMRVRDRLELAEIAALRALALDDSLAVAHLAIGFVRINQYDYAAAEAHFRRAAELDPAAAMAHERLVELYILTGRPADALAVAQRALELEPLSPAAHAELARALAANGQCEAALARLERLADLEPPLLRVAPIAAQCYARLERWTEAIAAMRQALEERGPRGHALLAYLLARAGQTEEALSIRDALLDGWRRGTGDPFAVGTVYVGLRDLDQAFEWFERTVDEHWLMPVKGTISIMDPILGELHEDARFEQLRLRLGLATS